MCNVIHCLLTLGHRYESMVPYSPTGEWSKMAPIRILSFDIECAMRGRTFPEHEHDSVIQIANIVTHNGWLIWFCSTKG